MRNLLKVNRKTMITWGISFGVVLLTLTGLWLVVVYFESEEPILQLSLTSPYIGSSRAISLHVSDRKSGIRSVWIALTKDGKEFVVLDRHFERTSGIRPHDVSLNVRIDPVKLGVSDGPALLRMVARDYSRRRWWHGICSNNDIIYISLFGAISQCRRVKPQSEPGNEILRIGYHLIEGAPGIITVSWIIC